MTTPERSLLRHRLRFRWLARQLERCLAVVGAVTLVYFGCFDLSRMMSDSMAPTLLGDEWRTGDLVLTERVSYWFRAPRRWEVITFLRNDGVRVMKRVVGLPGEQVQMLRDGRIVIDGHEIDRPPALEHLNYFPYGNLIGGKTASCGDGYYVLGDDSRDSDDSRFNGPVPTSQIMGRAWMVVAPKSRFGRVNR